MSCDRFVHWKEDKRPTREQIQLALEDYVRDLADFVEWDERGNRFLVKLPGMGSNPAARVTDSAAIRQLAAEERKNERWFEVYMGDDHIDVITRHGDWITNAIATEFAKLCAQFWKGSSLQMG